MKFNSSKCKILHIGKNNPKFEYTLKEGDLNVPLTLKMPWGGKIYPPLDLFVDNFFIVGRIDLKFSVNSYN